MIEYEFPVTLGRDFAGVVEVVGSSVSRYQTGDEVYRFLPLANPTVHNGTWADYAVVPENTSVARKPGSLDFVTAGAAPVAALTALAALDAFELAEGDTILVVGAPGGVGSFFVQLAAAAGANVVAPALPEDREYLRGLGATEVIDRNADVAAHVRENYPDGVRRASRSRLSHSRRNRPQAGRTACLTAWRRRGRARPCQPDGIPDNAESRAARQTARRRHAERPDPAHASARAGPGGPHEHTHPGKARDHNRLETLRCGARLGSDLALMHCRRMRDCKT